MNDFELFLEKTKDFGINLSEDQIEKFKIFLTFFQEYNSHTNLVSKADAQIVASKHFLDSLAIHKLADQIDLNKKLSLIDIGIGGGFPGIPIIIAFPGIKLCAVDSVNKKLEFIRLLAEKLGISDRVEVVKARAEEIARIPDKREKFDIATIRAVAKMNVISEYCLPLIKKDGYFIAYKARTVDEELKEAEKAISVLGGKLTSTIKYSLSEQQERSLILVKKIKPTPEQYPRKTGVPAKRPLI